MSPAATRNLLPPPAPPHISLSADTLRFDADSNGVKPDAQELTISNSGDDSLTWSMAIDSGWISAMPLSGDASTETATVNVETTALSPGEHNASITVSSPEADNSPQSIAVVYTISEQLAHIETDSNSLSFRAFTVGTLPLTQDFILSNSGGRVLDWTVSDDAHWLTVTPSSGTGNNTSINAAITTTDLALGEYTATITVTSENADNSPHTIPVTYKIEPQPRIDLDSTILTFASTEEGALPNSASFNISNGGGGTLAWGVSDDVDWFKLSPESGNGNSNLISGNVTSTSLAAGDYSASITVTSSNAENSPQNIMVIYNVSEQLAHIEIDSMSLSYCAITNGILPPAQEFIVFNSAGRTLDWTISDDVDWLIVTPKSGTANNVTISASITTTDLALDEYSATISVTSTNADNSPQTIPVTYTIEPPPRIDLDTTVLTFLGAREGALPGTGKFRITNGGGGTLAWNVNDDADWLELSPQSGTGTPSIVSAIVTSTSLSIGNYVATISVTSSTASNSPQTIDVFYEVAEQVAHITLDSSSYEFAAFQNHAKPKLRTFTISNSGGRTLSWVGVVIQDEEVPWLSINPEFGISNEETITMRILRTNLSAGTHIGTIRFTSPNADNSPQDITVTYTLTPIPPK